MGDAASHSQPPERGADLPKRYLSGAVRDPTAKNAKKGLSPLFASTRQFLRMVSDHSLDAVA